MTTRPAPSETTTETTRRTYAVVGTGSRSRMYVDAATTTHADVAELVALADPNAVRVGVSRDRVASTGAEPAIFAGPDATRDVLATAPDVVVVTSPDHTHADVAVAALEAGADVVVEKPLTTSADGVRRLARALEASGRSLVMTFNYRYSPRNSRVKELLATGAIGDVTAVHFEWCLDTAHGADYFRRWHRDKAGSGGLQIHKSSHHFDLVNWWLDDVAEVVFARGGLRRYGDGNAPAAGRPRLGRDVLGADPGDPWALDLARDETLRTLYLEAEGSDGYQRDVDVFAPGVTIEDTLSVLVGYRGGANLTYALNAYSPWEGYRVAFTGTLGRLELDVVERSWVPAPGEGHGRVVDPSAAADETAAASVDVRPPGTRLTLQRHWERAEEVEIPMGSGAHGGGDAVLLDDVFRGVGSRPDPLGRSAGLRDGVAAVAVGLAVNASLDAGTAVRVADLDLAGVLDDGAEVAS
ncbi:oxidoreductase domain protein [Beutenbergia cavernae DSM 12333]|uniref:Oxidoreductase domain protein n=1 Tax=Beutenbergia cavernae (strain ATCC BAA-8 / DSM 12333 / CCUG 43141 / JCM 11478 / NBRC 16432 / NCIMB 13614 / HKI 0122) TaxID=471853 RepID=C5BYU3_BEUC1|nr:Gfo/Idh/MocA family oxidoreductase [Beutenbergia cavernae]ACQ79051.1 oxidoreductase domain protein [Beutenbergia cavernae DSM 12333]